MKRLIFGCGYLGLRVAKLWRDAGDQVFCVTRSADRAKELSAWGLQPHIADVTDPASLTNLPAADTLLFAVGYDRTQPLPIEAVYVQGLQNVLQALPPTISRIVYISSTGVYGDAAGDWVDEATPCQPTRVGGQACLAAENMLLAHPHPAQKLVLRLAGIYGPGRLPRRADLLAQKPIPGLADGYLNLIHVDDAAAVAVQVADGRALPPEVAPIFNVTDGHPVIRREYHQFLAELCHAPPPVFVETGSLTGNQRGGSDKRVSNRKLVDNFSPQFRYPDYRASLRAAMAGETESH